MLSTWIIQNFKSVCDKTTLTLAPLTIFAGANSSGKSTIIQSILLATQTLQNSVASRSVVLNGNILRIGAFNDIVFNNQESKNILIGFELTPSNDEHESYIPTSRHIYGLQKNEALSSINFSFTFSSYGSEDEKQVVQLHPRLEECQIHVKSKLENRPNEELIQIRRSKKAIHQRIKDNHLSEKSLSKVEFASLEYEVVKSDDLIWHQRYSTFSKNAKPLGALLNHFLPEKIYFILDAIEEQSRQIAYLPLPEMLKLAVDYTQEFFTRFVKYLSHFRDEPKPIYSLAGTTDSKDVGFRGENTTAVLEFHRNTKVEYIPSTQLKSGLTAPTPISDFLLKAVLDWLNYMGVASDVKTIDKEKLGYELKVDTANSGALHDLTHVGVGVNQILPILVQSLLAEKGSTLIFEQPELHLHPRVQTRLADFFISMTLLNKQCIIETHSEYLINRLRYQAAASEGDNISQNVLIYFVDKPLGESIYKPIKLNKFGVLEDWPKGFFDENEENARAIIKAAIEKRKKETIK